MLEEYDISAAIQHAVGLPDRIHCYMARAGLLPREDGPGGRAAWALNLNLDKVDTQAVPP